MINALERKNLTGLSVIFFLSVGVTSAWAEPAPTPSATPETSIATSERSEVTQLNLGLGQVNTHSRGHNYGGLGLNAQLLFPADSMPNTAFGFSFRRTFSSEPVKRYDILTHFNYYISDRLKAGVMGGLQFISAENETDSYLKPLVGIELAVRLFSWSRFKWSRSAISLYTDFRYAAGSTGSLLLNGGQNGLRASLFSVGLAYSFAVFDGS